MFFKEKNQYNPLTLTVQTVEVHKHLSLLLDKRLDFNIHIDNKINKCNKNISKMKRLSLSILRNSLLTTYKTFACQHLDYADILHEKHVNVNFE